MKAQALRLYDAGFRQLVSIIPPNAPLSPASRIQLSQLGKTPGMKGENGTWHGYDWLRHETTKDDIKRWANDGANLGLLAGFFPGVDIDTLDPWLADLVQQVAIETLGAAPCRVGRAPKRLLMYRAVTPFARMAMIVQKDGQKHLVEVLSAGRQYVIHGTHPSGSTYTWDQDIADLNLDRDLHRVGPEKIDAFFEALAVTLELHGLTTERVGDGKTRDRETTPQADLLAPSLDALRACVDLIPNDDTFFPGREEYVKFGYAVRAASGESDEEGYDIFASWAGRHAADARVSGNAETWRSDWRRMHPPYVIGWPWLAEIAATFGFQKASYEFEADRVAEAQADAVDDAPPKHSDQWLADRVLEECGTLLRYVHASKQWYVWNGHRWVKDATLLADHMIGSALRHQAALESRHGGSDTEQKKALTEAKKMCDERRVVAIRTLLRTYPSIAATPDAFDADPWMLNTPVGVVDLRTGSVLPADPALMCSRQTIVAPDFDARSTLWESYLIEACGGDLTLVTYLQRLAGYALTGLTHEQMLAFIYGEGGRGKSTFTETLQYVWQDYAQVAPMEAFVSTTFSRHPTDIAGLAGARAVFAVETHQGREWDEQRLKTLTGGDTVSARFMRQDYFTFHPQFKLLFIGNHKPRIATLDDAMRRRIHLVPFPHLPRTTNKLLKEQLRSEAPAILAWAVRGCLTWQEQGLTPPAVVIEATQSYFEEEDIFGEFFNANCVETAGGSTHISSLYLLWTQWCNARGAKAGWIGQLRERFEQRSFFCKRDAAQPGKPTVVLGVTLSDDANLLGVL